jgi:hypothetical protein
LSQQGQTSETGSGAPTQDQKEDDMRTTLENMVMMAGFVGANALAFATILIH